MFSRIRLAWQNGPGRALHSLPLADRFLLGFFLVLLGGSASMLLWPEAGPSGGIDIIVRTSAASVFGYLLSSGLSPLSPPASGSGRLPMASGSPDPAQTAPVPAGPAAAPAAPGEPLSPLPAALSAAPDSPGPADGPTLPTSPAGPGPSGSSPVQIWTAAGVGIFCLAALLLLRSWPGRLELLAASDSAIAVLTQFRDFISGSLGYLIGCSSRQTDPPSA